MNFTALVFRVRGESYLMYNSIATQPPLNWIIFQLGFQPEIYHSSPSTAKALQTLTLTERGSFINRHRQHL